MYRLHIATIRWSAHEWGPSDSWLAEVTLSIRGTKLQKAYGGLSDDSPCFQKSASWRFKCRLRRGRYEIVMHATDGYDNTRTRYATLRVR